MTKNIIKDYDVLIFDLDGTLSESTLAITKGVQYALSSFGINVSDLSKLEYFIGPPMIGLFQKNFGFSKEKAEKGVEKYREYYIKQGYKEQFPFEGVKKMIESLSKKGKKMVIATSKPTEFALDVLKMYAIKDYFSPIIGSRLDHTRTTKTEVLEYTLSLLKKYPKDKMVMIGDREHDINAANTLGIDSIGVLYGYGSEEEVKSCNPTYIVNTIEELKNLILA